jgi:RNA polymerase sigma-70 factor (ECF subfamily)
MVAQFATTQWSDVLRAGATTSPTARLAMETLCAAYWYPLYAYVRRRGVKPEDAQDLTQGFFQYLVETDLLRAADPVKGRFRSFLLTCMKNYMSHERQRAAAAKRGGGVITINIGPDSEARFSEEAPDLDPEALYERRWALTLMERAMANLAGESAANPDRWQALRPLLTGGDPEDTYRTIGEQLGMSDGAVRVAVHRMRKRYGELLRQEVADTVGDPAQIDDELRRALTAIGPAGSGS